MLSMLALLEPARPDVPFQALPQKPVFVNGQPCERSDCLLIVRPGRAGASRTGAPLPPEAAMAHVVEAS
jgi:hypothetical protein